METDLNWVMQTITTIGIGVIGFFLKGTMAELKEQGRANTARIEATEEKLSQRFDDKLGALEKELDDLKSDLPFIYVTREDFIRTMNNVDKKLDKIHDSMMGGGRSG